MAKRKEKQRAIQLRKSGKSYSQIREIVGVSKSTLSRWLADYPLSDRRIRELRDWSEKRIENYRETRRKKREELLGKIYQNQKRSILPFSERDVFISGLFLYLGEGGKTRNDSVSLSNTDPAVAAFFILWLEKSWGVERERILIRLHLYEDMEIQNETVFWSKRLGLPVSQFRNPYIKKSSQSEVTYRTFGHGTCNVIVYDATLSKKVLMGLRVVSDHISENR